MMSFTLLLLFRHALSVTSFAPNAAIQISARSSLSKTKNRIRSNRFTTSISSCKPMKNIVLIGGGHAHLQVIKAFNEKDRPNDWNVTLVDKSSFAAYSGMVPGCISNLYEKGTEQIALRPLAEWASVDFLHDTVVGVDTKCQQILLKGGDVVDYDVLSLDIGSMSRGMDTPGVFEYTIPTRPIDALVDRIEEAQNCLSKEDSVKAVIVGGGVAGIELAMCIHSRFGSIVDDVDLIILDSGTELLSSEPDLCREAMQEILDEKKINVRYGSRVHTVEKDIIELEDGTRIPFTHCVWSAGASPHPLSSQLGEAGISVSTDGWIQVGPTLQTQSHQNIFAAGDCAAIAGLQDPKTRNAKRSPPKAGVYAVRSGPILIENISRYLQKSNTETACDPLIAFDPQDDFLKLIGCGDGTALGFRFGLPLRGKWVWELKDAIDGMFMDLFRVENLPDLSEEGNGLDSSQYDAYVKKSERLSAEDGARLLLRSDDDVDYQDAWDVLRDMAADDQYKQEVLGHSPVKSLQIL